jgi:hypothetical protein
MEPDDSLRHSQAPTTCSYPEPVRSSPYPTTQLKIHLNIIHSCTPESSNYSLSLRFPNQTLYVPFLSSIRIACPAYLILLDLIIRIIFDEQYRSYSCFYWPSVTPPSMWETMFHTHIQQEKKAYFYFWLLHIVNRVTKYSSPNENRCSLAAVFFLKN